MSDTNLSNHAIISTLECMCMLHTGNETEKNVLSASFIYFLTIYSIIYGTKHWFKISSRHISSGLSSTHLVIHPPI